MHSSLAVAGAVCIAAWLYLLLGHGRFWMVWRLGADAAPPGPATGLVAAVIPARNEADVVGAAVQSLLQQSSYRAIHIYLVDDNSSDGTAEAAREAAAFLSRSDDLTVIAGKPLPSGWSGKLWALEQGIEQALARNPKFLLLTDADVEHAPANGATLVALADREGWDLVSFMVKLHCQSAAEKLLIPAFVFFFFMLYPPEWIRDPRRRTAGAAGGCMLIRPEALTRAGGIAAIRGEVIDDCALAAAVKRSGGRVWLGLTPDTHSLRAYGSFGEIERMIARTAFNQLQHSIWLLAGALAGLALVYLLPVALLFTGSPRLVALGATAYTLMFIAYAPMVRFYRLSPVWALLLPASAAFYMAASMHSAFEYWRGHGGEWKGRVQDRADLR